MFSKSETQEWSAGFLWFVALTVLALVLLVAFVPPRRRFVITPPVPPVLPAVPSAGVPVTTPEPAAVSVLAVGQWGGSGACVRFSSAAGDVSWHHPYPWLLDIRVDGVETRCGVYTELKDAFRRTAVCWLDGKSSRFEPIYLATTSAGLAVKTTDIDLEGLIPDECW